MKLIIILLCLWLDHYMHVGSKGRQQQYFNLYENFLKKYAGGLKLWQGPGSLALIALPLIILVGGLQWYGAFHSNLLTLLLGVAVLLFCLGASPLQAKIDAYLASSNIEESEPEKDLKQFMHQAGVKTRGAGFFRCVTELEFWQSHERFFSVVFWFLILGPVGALTYRMISWFHDNALHGDSMYPAQTEQLTQLHAWAAWPSSRIVALSYALVGNFMPSFEIWIKQALKVGVVQEVLVDCGMASLGANTTDPHQADKAENQAAQALIHRALLVWVLIIALATLGQLFL